MQRRDFLKLLGLFPALPLGENTPETPRPETGLWFLTPEQQAMLRQRTNAVTLRSFKRRNLWDWLRCAGGD